MPGHPAKGGKKHAHIFDSLAENLHHLLHSPAGYAHQFYNHPKTLNG